MADIDEVISELHLSEEGAERARAIFGEAIDNLMEEQVSRLLSSIDGYTNHVLEAHNELVDYIDHLESRIDENNETYNKSIAALMLDAASWIAQKTGDPNAPNEYLTRITRLLQSAVHSAYSDAYGSGVPDEDTEKNRKSIAGGSRPAPTGKMESRSITDMEKELELLSEGLTGRGQIRDYCLQLRKGRMTRV